MIFRVKYADETTVVIWDHTKPKQAFDGEEAQFPVITYTSRNVGPNAIETGDEIELSMRKVIRSVELMDDEVWIALCTEFFLIAWAAIDLWCDCMNLLTVIDCTGIRNNWMPRERMAVQ